MNRNRKYDNKNLQQSNQKNGFEYNYNKIKSITYHKAVIKNFKNIYQDCRE